MFDRKDLLEIAMRCYDAKFKASIQEADVECYVVPFKDGYLFAFRASREPGDFVRDALAMPRLSWRLKIFMHRGISKGAIDFWPRVFPTIMQLSGQGPIYLAGFSKGGCDALVTGCMMLNADIKPAAIVTFGAPPIGYSGLKKKLADVEVIRIEHISDPVPHHWLTALMGYKPVGRKLPIGNLPDRRGHHFGPYLDFLLDRHSILEFDDK